MRWAIALTLLLSGCDRQQPIFPKGTIIGPLPKELAISPASSGGEKLSDVGRDGLRVLIVPSFGRYRYYASMRRVPAGCTPRARRALEKTRVVACGPAELRVRRIEQRSGTVDSARFFLPVEESDALVDELDARLARWSGTSLAIDGTGIDLERVRDGRIVSLSGNASSGEVDDPTTWLSSELLRILLAYGPAGFAPRLSDWHVRIDPVGEDSCNEPALATPLDRGFGVGNSDCDATKRWPQ